MITFLLLYKYVKRFYFSIFLFIYEMMKK